MNPNHHRRQFGGSNKNPWAGFAAMGREFGKWDFDFDFDPFRGGKQRGRHTHGRRRMFGPGELRLVLLKLIADEPRHGYELIKAIEEMTGGEYTPSPGTIYPTLQLLADEGAIEEAEGEGARRPFAATFAGNTELEERAAEVERLMARLAAMHPGDAQDRGRSPEVLRALVNLGRVLRNRAFSGKYDSATLDQVVDIIDDAAKRIERL